MVVVGSALLVLLPESVQSILTYILPALFGAIFIQFALMSWQAAVGSLVVSVLILTVFSNIIPGNYQAFVAVVASIVLNVAIARAAEKKSKASEGNKE